MLATELESVHDAKIDAVCEQVRALAASGHGAHIEKGGVHHFVPIAGDARFSGSAVDISALDAILDIDVEARTCTAEPGATFAAVVRATLAHGLLPKVVPELEGITLGGAVAGCSVESMSYKYGGFHDTCLEYEVVSGLGERRLLSPQSGADLFHMIHGSYGTLAILTRLRFELVEAAPFVSLEYRRHGDGAAFEADMRACCADPGIDFVDGIIHGPRELILCVGRFADEAEGVSDYRGAKVYYRSTRKLQTDVMTTFDYCFRYETDCHWLAGTVGALEWGPVRRLVGRWFLGSANLIRWSKRTEKIFGLVRRRPDVVVDVFIPGRRFGDFWHWYVSDFRFWPLWIVPYRVDEPYPWIAASHREQIAGDLMIDCAVYGKRNNKRHIDYSEAIEQKTYELGGIKTLISHNHHTRERFWQIYNLDNWSAAKRELDPAGLFRELYEKFH